MDIQRGSRYKAGVSYYPFYKDVLIRTGNGFAPRTVQSSDRNPLPRNLIYFERRGDRCQNTL